MPVVKPIDKLTLIVNELADLVAYLKARDESLDDEPAPEVKPQAYRLVWEQSHAGPGEVEGVEEGTPMLRPYLGTVVGWERGEPWLVEGDRKYTYPEAQFLMQGIGLFASFGIKLPLTFDPIPAEPINPRESRQSD
jgi:hypothetical protein